MSGFLRAKFLLVCPYGKQYLDNLVRDCRIKMLLLAVASCVVILVWNSIFENDSPMYIAACIFLALYLISMEVPNFLVREKEDKVFRELLMYFSRVKHRYMACHHVANAVIDASDGMLYEIQKLADSIYQVLMESERKEKVREYILTQKTNRYLKLFLIQAYEVSEKGGVFFSENIEHLRLELMEEIYRRKQRAHEFAGYVFVTVTPFFMMPLLKQWGLEFAPELEFFYVGTGVLLEIVTFVVTIFIYGMILRAREITLFSGEADNKLCDLRVVYKTKAATCFIRNFNYTEGKISNGMRKLLLQSGDRTSYGELCFQMVSIAISTFLALSAFYMQMHGRERTSVLEKVDSIESIAPTASEEKQEILAGHIIAVTRQCVDVPEITEEEVQKLLREKVRLANDSMERSAVQEIMKKLEQYRQAKGSPGEFFICCFAGIFAGMLPLLKLYYQARTVKAGAVHEVKQFQSLILMTRKLQGVTIVGLLEDMEVFAQCFKSSLQRCLNSYCSGPEEALLRLKEDGSCIHEGFEELADAFLSVDEVGIELAFAEVESNRHLLEKMTQLEAEISMERKKDSTDLLAKIPMVLAVGAYFILPFFTYSLQGVYEIFELLEGMDL